MIIGLIGPAKAGKSTVANVLAKSHGFTVISVASPIRSMLLSLGLTPEHFQGRAKEQPIGWLGNRSPRDLMNGLGQWGRDLSPTLWAGILEARLDAHSHVVVDDIRLPLEAAAIRARRGWLWRIQRAEQIKAISNKMDDPGRLIEVDATLNNLGGVADLERAALDQYLDLTQDA